MLAQRLGLSRLCLVCILTVVFCLQSCSKKRPTSNDNPTADKAAEPSVKRTQYANDLDRLGQLTERINGARGGAHVVVFGAGDIKGNGGLVSIDYGLFDKLSDDGAAVLIAEAIVAKSKPLSQTQAQASNAKVVLGTDEAVGSYVARAGFSPDGFVEWLRAQKVLAANLRQSDLPEKMRIAAFMRGYSSVHSVR